MLGSASFAATIVENLGGSSNSTSSYFWGQSFTTPSGGPWNNVIFNFFSNVPATTPIASGTAFLLDQVYAGTPSGLNAAVPGFIAASTGVSGGQYVFASGVLLQPGTQYFVFEDSSFTITGDNVISGGQVFYTAGSSSNFGTAGGTSANFRVTGDVVPEPSSLALLAGGLALLTARYRRRT